MMVEPLKPGPELDALVAERVMGWSQIHLGSRSSHRGEFGTRMHGETGYYGIRPGDQDTLITRVKSYSTDMAAAWGAVDCMREKHQATFRLFTNRYDEVARCRFLFDSLDLNMDLVEGQTAPHAICLAALKALSSSDG